MKLIPFDLERAKAGDPVVTMDGRKARYIGDIRSQDGHDYVFAHEDDEGTEYCETHLKSGHCYNHDEKNLDDLFMAPKTRKIVYGLIKLKNTNRVMTYDEAGDMPSNMDKWEILSKHEIEIEVEE